jgi:hypothetical protein
MAGLYSWSIPTNIEGGLKPNKEQAMILKVLQWEGWSLITAVTLIVLVVGVFSVFILPSVEQFEIDQFRERQRLYQKSIDDGLGLPTEVHW